MRTLRTGLSLLLALAVLVGGVTPPGVRHAHAQGDQDHNHRQAAMASHSEEHEHGHSHPHEHGDRSTLAQGATPHVHLTLLWFDFCLPVGHDQEVPDDGSTPSDYTVALVRLLDTEVVLASGPAVESLCSSTPLPTPICTKTVTACCLQDRQDPLSSVPLCDSARKERSGVQLI